MQSSEWMALSWDNRAHVVRRPNVGLRSGVGGRRGITRPTYIGEQTWLRSTTPQAAREVECESPVRQVPGPGACSGGRCDLNCMRSRDPCVVSLDRWRRALHDEGCAGIRGPWASSLISPSVSRSRVSLRSTGSVPRRNVHDCDAGRSCWSAPAIPGVLAALSIGPVDTAAACCVSSPPLRWSASKIAKGREGITSASVPEENAIARPSLHGHDDRVYQSPAPALAIQA